MAKKKGGKHRGPQSGPSKGAPEPDPKKATPRSSTEPARPVPEAPLPEAPLSEAPLPKASKSAASDEISPPAATVDVEDSRTSDGAEGGADPAATPGPKYAAPLSSAPPSSVAEPPRRRGSAWGKPFVTVEKWWTWLEVRVLVGVILGLVFSMVLWVSLQGMSSPVESESIAGVAFRAVVGAIGFGLLGWFASLPIVRSTDKALKSRGIPPQVVRTLLAVAGIAVGVMLAPRWRGAGVEYFGHVQNWLQEGSSLTMFGQLRGVSTRLTVVLAFIGGSLAAATGKHINIDIALRFVSDRLKVPVFIAQMVATVAFCFVAAWAFFEYIAITSFNAKPDMTASQKIEIVDQSLSEDLFLWRKQIGFDLSATPHVLGGGKWDDPVRLNGRQWNEFLEESGYRDYFTPEEIQNLKAPDEYLDESRLPLAIGPEGPPRNLLVRTMNLTFTLGFLLMGLRFLLRLILVLSGHQSMEAESDYDPDADPKRHAERERAAEDAAHETGKDVA